MKIEIHIKGDNLVLLTPMNFANAMVEQGLFKTDELEELAEYLLVFCKHNKEDDRGGRCSLNDPDVINMMLDKQ